MSFSDSFTAYDDRGNEIEISGIKESYLRFLLQDLLSVNAGGGDIGIIDIAVKDTKTKERYYIDVRKIRFGSRADIKYIL